MQELPQPVIGEQRDSNLSLIVHVRVIVDDFKQVVGSGKKQLGQSVAMAQAVSSFRQSARGTCKLIVKKLL
jgi:hypothetical protein